jgi:hypothetical protein
MSISNNFTPSNAPFLGGRTGIYLDIFHAVGWIGAPHYQTRANQYGATRQAYTQVYRSNGEGSYQIVGK